MKIEQFAFEAKNQPVLLAMAGLTKNEWQAIKDFVFYGAILEADLLEQAKTKVSDFTTYMQNEGKNV